MHKNVVSLCQRWIHYMWCLCQLIRWSHILLALQEHTPKCCMQSLRWLILERITSFQEPSYMCQLHEADYYCKTKKKQNVKCIAIVISEDNKRDYHCQSVTLVGGLLYWTNLLLLNHWVWLYKTWSIIKVSEFLHIDLAYLSVLLTIRDREWPYNDFIDFDVL